MFTVGDLVWSRWLNYCGKVIQATQTECVIEWSNGMTGSFNAKQLVWNQIELDHFRMQNEKLANKPLD